MEKLYRNGMHCGNLGDPALYYGVKIEEVLIDRCDQ